jgi:hypothetical protein
VHGPCAVTSTYAAINPLSQLAILYCMDVDTRVQAGSVRANHLCLEKRPMLVQERPEEH